MADDQYTQRDPRDQYPRPEEQRGQEQGHPGTGSAMAPVASSASTGSTQARFSCRQRTVFSTTRR